MFFFQRSSRSCYTVRKNETNWLRLSPSSFSPSMCLLFLTFQTPASIQSSCQGRNIHGRKRENNSHVGSECPYFSAHEMNEHTARLEIAWWLPGSYGIAHALWPPCWVNIGTIVGSLIKNAHSISAQPLSNNGSDRRSLGIVLQQCAKGDLGRLKQMS